LNENRKSLSENAFWRGEIDSGLRSYLFMMIARAHTCRNHGSLCEVDLNSGFGIHTQGSDIYRFPGRLNL
jgi:hypothetical protein